MYDVGHMDDSDVRDNFFFFHAEDGIRYLTVTGVQTCALPISGARGFCRCRAAAGSRPTCCVPRSEERRVGKEGISRCSTVHSKNDINNTIDDRPEGAEKWLLENEKSVTRSEEGRVG